MPQDTPIPTFDGAVFSASWARQPTNVGDILPHIESIVWNGQDIEQRVGEFVRTSEPPRRLDTALPQRARVAEERVQALAGSHANAVAALARGADSRRAGVGAGARMILPSTPWRRNHDPQAKAQHMQAGHRHCCLHSYTSST